MNVAANATGTPTIAERAVAAIIYKIVLESDISHLESKLPSRLGEDEDDEDEAASSTTATTTSIFSLDFISFIWFVKFIHNFM